MAGVRIEALSKSFGVVEAVSETTLEVRDGEFLSLLGPSGCGKTTLLRMVAGFTTPTTGKIRLGERDITGLPPEKRGVGMVFQNYALFPHMTVEGNVSFGLEVRGIPKSTRSQQVERALARVGLEKLADRPVSDLSGGEQQRVALARAIVIEPDVLLLDEPLSNLDAALRVQTRTEIRRLQRALGFTTIYVTHDQEEALALSDRIAVMRSGKIQQVGPPVEVYTRPINRFVGGFLGRGTFFEGKLIERVGEGAVLECDALSGRLGATTCPDELSPGESALILIRTEDIEVLSSDAPESQESATGTNGLPTWRSVGSVVACEFLGPHVRLDIEVNDPGATSLQALRSARGAVQSGIATPGAAVKIQVAPDAVWIIKESAGDSRSD